MRRFGVMTMAGFALAASPCWAARHEQRAVGVRVSSRAAVVTIWRGEKPRHVLVRHGGSWRYAHNVVYQGRRVRVRIPVGRHARAVRMLIVTWRGSTRLRVPLHEALPQPCGPEADPAPGDRPPACWRPYSATSPFNVELPAAPVLDPHSDDIVD